MKTAICAGSYNPVTRGHLDIIERASAVFDEVIALLVYNSAKHYDVSAEMRLELLRRATAHLPNVRAEVHVGLLVDYAMAKGDAVLVKGVRSESDLEAEMTMAYANSAGSRRRIDTLLMPTRPELTYVSSTIVREFASYGGDIDELVPACVREDIAKLYYKGERR